MTVITKRTVVGTYLKIDGTPCKGYVEFTPNTLIVRRGDAIIPVSYQRAELSDTGFFSIDLAVTDDDTWIPNTWVWAVDEKMVGGKVWFLEVPTGVGVLDISTVVPITSPALPLTLDRRVSELESRLALIEGRL